MNDSDIAMRSDDCLPQRGLTVDKGFRVYRIVMHCTSQVCLQRCTCSFLACKKEPDIGSSLWKPNLCILHDKECSWRVKEYYEVPELTEVLCREDEV